MIEAEGKEFGKFVEKMTKAINEHYSVYGESWKEMSLGKLHDRLKHKYAEFDLTYNKQKLISLANLCMLLYIRLEDGGK